MDRQLGAPRLVIDDPSGFARASILDLDAAVFEAAWMTGAPVGSWWGRRRSAT